MALVYTSMEGYFASVFFLLLACVPERGLYPETWTVSFPQNNPLRYPISDWQEFEVPEGVVSFNLTCGDDRDGVEYSIYRFEGPMGTIVSLGNGQRNNPHYYPLGYRTGLVVEQFPASPSLPLEPGVYRFRLVVKPTDEETECSLVWRDGPIEHGTFDLSFHVASSTGLDAERAEVDPVLQGSITEMTALLAQADIHLGAVQYADLPEHAFTEPLEISESGPSAFTRIRRELEPEPSGAIPVLLVSVIQSSESLVSFADGASPVPGAVRREGCGGNGIAVAYSSMDSAEAGGHILAHEIGHYLGLNHPAEANGVLDALDDTPPCLDADGDGWLQSSECPGSDNLMWWAAGEEDTALTDDQAWVLQRSPALL